MEAILKISTFIVLFFQCLSGYFCQDRLGNVALNKKCTMSSIWYRERDNPQFAVNNNTDGTYGIPPTNCIHTGQSDPNPWWEVELGRPYPVSSITVWAREHVNFFHGIGRMSGCVITVDNKECYTFPTLPSNSPRQLNVNCTSGIIVGSKVRVSKNVNTDNFITFCEFQVWSCRDPYWGRQCENNCGHCADGEVCDKISGRCICSPGFKPPLCVDECDDGTYGQHCSSKCSENCDGVCDKKTGTCSCKPGWKTQSQFCDDECDDGTYGQNCSLNCGKCTNNQVCDKKDGTCLSCPPGLIPPLCRQECNAGTYGQDCNIDCGQGCNNTFCHSVTGQCECVAGWQPPVCQQELSQEGHLTGTIVGSVVAVIVVIAIAAVLFIIIRKRRMNGKPSNSKLIKKTPSKPEDVAVENKGFDNCDNDGKAQVPKFKSSQQGSARTTDGAMYVNVSIGQGKQPTHSSPQIRESSTDPDVFDVDEDDGSVDDAYIYESLYSNSAESGQAWDPVQLQLLNKLKAGTFDRDFEAFPKGLTNTHEAGLSKENYNKNRFMSILPYDDSRVILQGPYDVNSNDYINASYIRGHISAKSYIAAQGPKRRTLDDFWKMVWQDHVTHIVMLTNLIEGEKSKCEEYWPPTGAQTKYGDIYVTGSGEQKRADFIIRTFDVRLKSSDVSRRIFQYHYMSWLDHSIPTPTALVDFWRTVRTSHRSQNSPSPLLVHCSAGVGRTGTYIALDIALDQTEQRSKIDIPAIVARLREDRCNMIQAKSQYIFLHEAVFEAYTSRHTRIDSSSFARVFSHDIDPHEKNDRIDGEFETLQKMRAMFQKPNYADAEKEENINKNRNTSILPDYKHVIHLTVHIPGRNQYINAVVMSTFKERMSRILTQLPLPETVLDLWRLVDGSDVTVILSLDARIDKKSFYWPRTTAQSMTFDRYTITLESQQEVGETVTQYNLSFKQKKESCQRHVCLLHYLNWTDEIPANSTQLLHLIDTLSTLRTDNSYGPVLIQCFDGASKSGLFSAACDVISRMTCDREVDVYMAVRHVQEVRPQSVASLIQYRYLFRLVQDFNKQMDVYVNT